MYEQNDGQMTFEFQERATIKGFPELRWTGKRPYRSTQYYPAQLKEKYGEEVNGWINKICAGFGKIIYDNHEVVKYRRYEGTATTTKVTALTWQAWRLEAEPTIV